MKTPESTTRSVVYVITALGVGGANLQVLALSSAFRARGWEVGIISMMPPKVDVSNLEADGIRVATLGMRRGIPDLRAVIRLRRHLRAWRPAVVHSHMVHANLLTRVTRPISDVPVLVSTAHSFNEGRTWRYLAYRLTDRLSDVTTNVSAAAMAEAIRRGAVRSDRVLLVPNGVDLARYDAAAGQRATTREELGIPDDAFVWLAAGRFVPAKDYPNMLEAFARFRANAGRATLLIAGIGLGQSAARRVGRATRYRAVRALPWTPERPPRADGGGGRFRSLLGVGGAPTRPPRGRRKRTCRSSRRTSVATVKSSATASQAISLSRTTARLSRVGWPTLSRCPARSEPRWELPRGGTLKSGTTSPGSWRRGSRYTSKPCRDGARVPGGGPPGDLDRARAISRAGHRRRVAQGARTRPLTRHPT